MLLIYSRCIVMCLIYLSFLMCVCGLLLDLSLLLTSSTEFIYFISSRRRHTSCALVTGVQTCCSSDLLNSPHREKALSYNIPIWFVLLTQQTKRSESMPRPDPIASDADALIDAVIDREGRYVNHPADRGGATCWGITEAVARAEGYAGAMRDLPRADAASIYRRLYWLRPGFDQVARRASKNAAEQIGRAPV